MTGRAYTAALHWLMRSRYGQRVGAVVGLALFRGAAWVERHQTDPIPPGERVGAVWRAQREGQA